jgi:hypothetical protein
LLAACHSDVDPVAAAAESARERTLPSRGRLAAAEPLRRGDFWARAGWTIETELAWADYAVWVVLRLSEYRVARRGGDRLVLTQRLDGDIYILVLVAKQRSAGLQVEAAFQAVPF